MIEANPNNSILLANYAKFLKEVIGDYGKAEEYLERSILANPRDGIVLSQYADLIWHTQENADRAESYYNQAVQSSPHDCYVHASYAKFLWETDKGEEKREEKEEVKLKEWQHKSDHKHTYPPHDLLQNYPTTTLVTIFLSKWIENIQDMKRRSLNFVFIFVLILSLDMIP